MSLTDRLRFSTAATARGIYHAAGSARFRECLRMLRVAEDSVPRVCFGWLEDPANAADARIGGAVKLGHLRDRFGESREAFNVLYLVSSVIHLVPHVEEVVAWAKARGVRFVWNQNGVAYPAWCGANYPWFNEPMRRLLHQADHVVYQSAFCREAADRYLGAVKAPSEVLWNPVDLEHFSPGRRDCGNGEAHLLAMGTNHAFYRVKAAIDCLAVLIQRGIEARLTVAGELRWPDGGREVAEYLRRTELQSRVMLLPRFTQDEAPALYRSADVLLHPKYKDPCPTVPIEAMGCGLPVVGSASGGMPELVGRDAGRLVPIEDSWVRDVSPDAGAMADAVCEVMADKDRFSVAARERAVKHFDREKWVDRHATIFRNG